MGRVYGSTVDRLRTLKRYLIWNARSRSDGAGMTGTAGRRGREHDGGAIGAGGPSSLVVTGTVIPATPDRAEGTYV